MKQQNRISVVCMLVLVALCTCLYGQTFSEQPLWPKGIENNPIQYPEEKVRTSEVRKSSLSQKNRVFSCVSNPAYVLHQPEKPNGTAIVICPGGGFRDVWFDREGNDFALFLKSYGITSLVLKYRTFNADQIGSALQYNEYIYHVYADAKQAIYLLRSRAKELGLDAAKIGIGGFSAGGALSLGTALEIGDDKLPAYAEHTKPNTRPDFACLIYPGIDPLFLKAIETKTQIPPMFLINGREDTLTPAVKSVDLFQALHKKGVCVELHIYAKGEHGFDSGVERGQGIATWRESFVHWLQDLGMMKN